MTPPERTGLGARFLVAVGLLVIPELVLTAAFGFGDLLSLAEVLEALVALVVPGVGLAALVTLWAEAAAGGRAARVAHWTAVVGTFVVVSALAWDLTAGRRVRDLGLRPAVVLGLALASSVALRAMLEARVERVGRVLATGAALAVGLRLADAFVFARLYPAFHLGLAVGCVGVAALGALHAPAVRRPRWRFRGRPVAPRGESRLGRVAAAAVAVAFVVAAPFVLRSVARAPNTSFVLERHATVVGKLLPLAAPAARAPVAPAVPSGASSPVAAGLGIDLAGRDVLLVTIDALRADRLRAYGGSGLTPEMDALAASGAVFTRAYTTTPHTSYALTSLLTGKFLRPILELPGASGEHVAMPERLRRYGYRTAAFYPPAIFFVDAERFRALEATGFGFEYRKQMYASADARVAQVSSYLSDAPSDRPVFVWVHFFEPHEPYDPPAEFATGEGDEAAYDGEVRVVDRAFGALVREFRRRRPGATVILTADHGEEFGDHGGRYHGSSLYDEQVRVPLVWSSPDVVTPRRVEAPVEHADIATTLLAALGMPRDARMRGDDLGPALRGDETSAPRFAFADIADERMVMDGRYKAICSTSSDRCRLYDLARDPRELRNLAGVEPARLDGLRAELARFVASIPATEAMALEDEAFPEALARAALGDRTVGPELVAMLEDPVAGRRAAAAAALGAMGHAPARARLDALSVGDPDAAVKQRACIATTALGSDLCLETARELARGEGEFALAAALVLARRGDASGAAAITRCVADATLAEDARVACISAAGGARLPDAVPALVAALDEVRFRALAADALGLVGDARARAALRAALTAERHVPARLPLARALFRLGDAGAGAEVRRFLGMASGIPDGVGALIEFGRGVGVVDFRRRPSPGMVCDAMACTASAPVVIPARARSRAVVRLVARPGATLVVRTRTFGPLQEGPSELSFDLSEPLALPAADGVRYVAFAVVPEVAEIPVPPPEPWDAGVDAASP